MEGKGKEAVCKLVTSVVCEHVGTKYSNGIEERPVPFPSGAAAADPLEPLSMSMSTDSALTQAAQREKFFAMHEELVR